MMNQFLKVIALSAVHLAVSRVIVAVTMNIDMFATDTGWITVVLGKTLIALTRILYFPIITLSLYSRQWFPGNWIYVPICANSLIWGAAMALVLWWWPKRR
jgi:hypothetical protein